MRNTTNKSATQKSRNSKSENQNLTEFGLTAPKLKQNERNDLELMKKIMNEKKTLLSLTNQEWKKFKVEN